MSNIIDLKKYRKVKVWAAMMKRLEQGPPIVIPRSDSWQEAFKRP